MKAKLLVGFFSLLLVLASAEAQTNRITSYWRAATSNMIGDAGAGIKIGGTNISTVVVGAATGTTYTFVFHQSTGTVAGTVADIWPLVQTNGLWSMCVVTNDLGSLILMTNSVGFEVVLADTNWIGNNFATTGYVGGAYVPLTRELTVGFGLIGGGTLDIDRGFEVDTSVLLTISNAWYITSGTNAGKVYLVASNASEVAVLSTTNWITGTSASWQLLVNPATLGWGDGGPSTNNLIVPVWDFTRSAGGTRVGLSFRSGDTNTLQDIYAAGKFSMPAAWSGWASDTALVVTVRTSDTSILTNGVDLRFTKPSGTQFESNSLVSASAGAELVVVITTNQIGAFEHSTFESNWLFEVTYYSFYGQTATVFAVQGHGQ